MTLLLLKRAGKFSAPYYPLDLTKNESPLAHRISAEVHINNVVKELHIFISSLAYVYKYCTTSYPRMQAVNVQLKKLSYGCTDCGPI